MRQSIYFIFGTIKMKLYNYLDNPIISEFREQFSKKPSVVELTNFVSRHSERYTDFVDPGQNQMKHLNSLSFDAMINGCK